ncbi:homeobox protein aristaless-like [Vespula maculifrons]|uniref:Uncharacterized protein n=4 Tax=Vespula TaxID=7451 RepID=A0A834K771_VESGE|nr:hypothetical protein HZH66_006371 [Vespula vulgaris]KAF7401140.1 hypothetical protein HZH68_006960 [Vespula germanica]KAF7425173.1 hypothetical protein H0235_007611 [Vespula pensylvanica]
MDLSTTPRRATDGLSDLQKTRVAKSVFSIRSLVDVEEAEFPVNEEEIINDASSHCSTIARQLPLTDEEHRLRLIRIFGMRSVY